MNRRKLLINPEMKNLDMNKDTYKLRREVMKYVYDAKKLDKNMPRIDVRITEDIPTTLGSSRVNKKIIWIPKRIAKNKDYNLRHVVYHEILHSAYGIDHHIKCPLMKPSLRKKEKLSKEKLDSLFKYWTRK